MKDIYDDKNAYCRSLGHYVPFRYCRLVNNDMPCRNIKDCWFEQVDIEQYLIENYREEELARMFAPQQEKITSLLDLIKKAQGTQK